MAGTHPDFITVTDPEHKYIPVDMVREIRDDMYIRPNEAEKKIYLFSQELRTEGQNALLKVLEEPPGYGVFMLLTDNPEKLLITVRSRAVELRLQGLSPEVLTRELKQRHPGTDDQTVQAVVENCGGYLGRALSMISQEQAASPQTEGFVEAFCRKETVQLLQVLVPMERWDREKLIAELTQWLQLLQQALFCRSGMAVVSQPARRLAAQRSSEELLKAVRLLEKAIEYAQGNVSPAAICGHLAWALR
jgi:DNA polymerase-3 subunit delta'